MDSMVIIHPLPGTNPRQKRQCPAFVYLQQEMILPIKGTPVRLHCGLNYKGGKL